MVTEQAIPVKSIAPAGGHAVHLVRTDWVKVGVICFINLAVFSGWMWNVSRSIEHRFTVIEQQLGAALRAQASFETNQNELLRQVREDIREVRARK
jgi:hypothetical protein